MMRRPSGDWLYPVGPLAGELLQLERRPLINFALGLVEPVRCLGRAIELPVRRIPLERLPVAVGQVQKMAECDTTCADFSVTDGLAAIVNAREPVGRMAGVSREALFFR